jgi:hypothetical protein
MDSAPVDGTCGIQVAFMPGVVDVCYRQGRNQAWRLLRDGQLAPYGVAYAWRHIVAPPLPVDPPHPAVF